jgi:hypothetical protein
LPGANVVNVALKPNAKTHSELSFPPQYSEQAKYLELADKFLSLEDDEDGHDPGQSSWEHNGELVRSIDSSKYFNQTKDPKAA